MNDVISYVGRRGDDGVNVVKIIEGGRVLPLPARTDLKNHSPTGFEFGYAGSGPSQLALAILADYLQDDAKALEYYYYFKMEVITQLRDDNFKLTADQVKYWVYSYENRNNPQFAQRKAKFPEN